MSMHLASSTSRPVHLDGNPVSRLRYSPRREVARSGRAALAGPGHDASVRARLEVAEPHGHSIEDDAPHGRGPDHAADRAQAEQEDIALVKLAAGKLAVALREVQVLLRGDRGARKSDALARCSAKGWIAVQGDAFAATQTFRVTPEGYRAAGLRVPPFIY